MVALSSQLLLEQLLIFGLSRIPHGGSVARFLPSAANNAMGQAAASFPGEQLLPWWGGALTLTGWGLLFAALGLVVTTRRDVT